MVFVLKNCKTILILISVIKVASSFLPLDAL